jgi:hypothetical protein
MAWSDTSTQVTDTGAFSDQMRDATEVVNYIYNSGGTESSVPAVVFDQESNREFDEGITSMNNISVVTKKTSFSSTPKVGDSFTYLGRSFTVENIQQDATTWTFDGTYNAKISHNKDKIT